MMLRAYAGLARGLRYEAQTPRALRELMILRTAQLTDSRYEWAHHRKMAARRRRRRREGRARWRLAREHALRRDRAGRAAAPSRGFTRSRSTTTHSARSSAPWARTRRSSSCCSRRFYECVARMIQALGLEVEPEYEPWLAMPEQQRGAQRSGLPDRRGHRRHLHRLRRRRRARRADRRQGADDSGIAPGRRARGGRGQRRAARHDAPAAARRDGALRPRHDAGDQRDADPHRCANGPDHDARPRGRDHHRQGLREGRRPARARPGALLAAAQARPDRAALADPRRHRAHRSRRRRDRRAPGGAR